MYTRRSLLWYEYTGIRVYHPTHDAAPVHMLVLSRTYRTALFYRTYQYDVPGTWYGHYESPTIFIPGINGTYRRVFSVAAPAALLLRVYVVMVRVYHPNMLMCCCSYVPSTWYTIRSISTYVRRFVLPRDGGTSTSTGTIITVRFQSQQYVVSS